VSLYTETVTTESLRLMLPVLKAGLGLLYPPTPVQIMISICRRKEAEHLVA